MNQTQAAPLILAEGGRPRFSIVVAVNATEAEKHAAEELAAYLNKISGAIFSIGPDSGKGPAVMLQFDPGLGGEEYELKVEGNTLVIAGGRPRGVLYGVYALLEDYLGVRWFTRDCEKVPQQDPLSVPGDLAMRFKPRFEYREPYWREALEDPDWAARNRTNSFHAPLDARHGGRIIFGTFVHTFNSILDPARHFARHPEYFSMVNGKRIAVNTQLCLTNPEVLKIAIATVREWIVKNPEANIFSVSQNDWGNPCQCPGCKAVDDAQGSHAGSMIHFVNAIAAAIEKDFPNVAIDTLAYAYTRKAPGSVIPRPNVIVRLCSIECCFSHPLDGCSEKTNSSFVADLKAWSKLTRRLYVWDYTTNFSHYLLPHPNLGVLDKNIRTFVDNGVVGVFEQGARTGGHGAELSELRSWVLAKLLWDPARNGDELIREYIAGAFGPAAGKIQEFIDRQREAAAASGEHVNIGGGAERAFLDAKNLRAWNKILDDAEKIAAGSGDAQILRRVRRVKLPVLYARLYREVGSLDNIGEIKWGSMARDNARELAGSRAVLEEFEHIIKAEDITNAAPFVKVAWRTSVWRELLVDKLPQVKAHRIGDLWKFKPDPDKVGIEAKWYAPEVSDAGWADVRSDKGVGWESQGFPDYLGYGWYRQAFEVPAGFDNRKYFYLLFGAADEDAEIWINGRKAFDHTFATTGLAPSEIWMTPFMFDPRPFLAPGQKNLVVLRILNTANAGGIWKPVYLVSADEEATPRLTWWAISASEK